MSRQRRGGAGQDEDLPAFRQDSDFDREFGATFKVLTRSSRPRTAAEREHHVPVVGRYPDHDDPKFVAAVRRQSARGGGGNDLPTRRGRGRRHTQIDEAPSSDEPEVVAQIEASAPALRVQTIDELDRILGNPITMKTEPTHDLDGRAYIPPAKSVDHCTPHVIDRMLRRFSPQGVDLDPCASASGLQVVEARIKLYGLGHGMPLPEISGLDVSWADLLDGEGLVFANPPYGRGELDVWIPKMVDEMLSSDLTVIALLPERSDRAVYQKYVTAVGSANAICKIRGRLKFMGSKDSAPFASILVIWTNSESAVDRFEQVCADDIDAKLKRPLGNVLRIPRTSLDERFDSQQRQLKFLVDRLGLDRDQVEDQIDVLGFDTARDRILSGHFDQAG